MKKIMIILLLLSPMVSAGKALSLKEGSGKFSIKGGITHAQKKITVFYHYPRNFDNKTSKVLFVVPGAGRNAWNYRDSWVEASEKHGVLILSPSYPEKFYPKFWNYNLARMISEVKFNKEKTRMESFLVVNDPKEWIFDDFDRIFDLVSSAAKLKAAKYDMFGHSAGGQLLHRYALFDLHNKAGRILAANSGWYTVPHYSEEFPYGLNKLDFHKSFYKVSFSKKLVVFLGEKDDASEKRGHLASNPIIDKQGSHRLERGRHFFANAQTLARQLNTKLNWQLKVIPGVGHDYKLMGKAAAEFLYGK